MALSTSELSQFKPEHFLDCSTHPKMVAKMTPLLAIQDGKNMRENHENGGER
jgi:hypothetical protein